MSLMPLTVIRELELERHGYNVTPSARTTRRSPTGASIKIYTDDAAKNYESISQFSRKDAETMPEGRVAVRRRRRHGALLLQVPPKVGSMQPRDLVDTLKTAWKARGLGVRGVGDVTRLFTMSVSDLLNDWFESDAVKGMPTVNGVIGTWAGPDSPAEPPTSCSITRSAMSATGTSARGFQQGGMGAVSAACRRSAESFGAEIRTNARCASWCRAGAPGVALENGEELRAPVVVTTIHPKIAFLDLIDRHELPPEFVRDIEVSKTRSGVVKINVAISEPPDFIADPGKEQQDHHTGSVELCFLARVRRARFRTPTWTTSARLARSSTASSRPPSIRS